MEPWGRIFVLLIFLLLGFASKIDAAVDEKELLQRLPPTKQVGSSSPTKQPTIDFKFELFGPTNFPTLFPPPTLLPTATIDLDIEATDAPEAENSTESPTTTTKSPTHKTQFPSMLPTPSLTFDLGVLTSGPTFPPTRNPSLMPSKSPVVTGNPMEPPTNSPSTKDPTPRTPTTTNPTTETPTTLIPTTRVPTSNAPTSTIPTAHPITMAPSTKTPTTPMPTTRVPTSNTPTAAPTTTSPTFLPTKTPSTANPSTSIPTTRVPTTVTPTSHVPTTAPTTAIPTYFPTMAPSTKNPTTLTPTTRAPTTPMPTSHAPTAVPTTTIPTVHPTMAPSTKNPTTLTPTTKRPTTAFPSNHPSDSPTKLPTNLPTVSPSASPTAFPTWSPTKAPSTSPTTRKPSKRPTFHPSTSPTPPTTPMPSRQPTFEPSKMPTFQPTGLPTPDPTNKPSKSPDTPTRPKKTSKPTTGTPSTLSPTFHPTKAPSKSPTRSPTRRPTTKPTTATPTKAPTHSPTLDPTKKPTKKPSNAPTRDPTMKPTRKPVTGSPTFAPTNQPSENPTTKTPTTSRPTTLAPSKFPTRTPTTVSPTKPPTGSPSKHPTRFPTGTPTRSPTTSPTRNPSFRPTKNPTRVPTISPTRTPSKAPSKSPTESPLEYISALPFNLTIETIDSDWQSLYEVVLCFLKAVLLKETSSDLELEDVGVWKQEALSGQCTSNLIHYLGLCKRLNLDFYVTSSSSLTVEFSTLASSIIDLLTSKSSMLYDTTLTRWGSGNSTILFVDESLEVVRIPQIFSEDLLRVKFDKGSSCDDYQVDLLSRTPSPLSSVGGTTPSPSQQNNSSLTSEGAIAIGVSLGIFIFVFGLGLFWCLFPALFSSMFQCRKEEKSSYGEQSLFSPRADVKPPRKSATYSFSHVQRWLGGNIPPDGPNRALATPISQQTRMKRTIQNSRHPHGPSPLVSGLQFPEPTSLNPGKSPSLPKRAEKSPRRFKRLHSRASSSHQSADTSRTSAGLSESEALFSSSATAMQSLSEFSVDLSKLKLGRVIGVGGNGRIFKARYAGSPVAVKELFTNPMTKDGATQQQAGFMVTGGDTSSAKDMAAVEAFYREFAHLRLLKHPNVIQLFGLAVAQSNDTGAARYLLVMELADCSLDIALREFNRKRAPPGDNSASPVKPRGSSLSLDEDQLSSTTTSTIWTGNGRENPSFWSVPAVDSPMTEKVRWCVDIAQQICSGMAYIHHKNMIHFDLKPGNILLKNGDAKICDLGIAKLLNEKQILDVTSPNRGGTPSFMAPELLRGEMNLVTTKVDVYAYGIVLWQLFHREPPHPRHWSVAQLFNEVMNNHHRPAINSSLTPEPIAKLIRSCWSENPDDRPSFPQISVSLEVFQPDAESEAFAEGGLVSIGTYVLGESVRMWSSHAKKLAKGTVCRVRPNGTYDIEFDDGLQPALGVNGVDLIPGHLGFGGDGPTILSTIHSQQSIGDLAAALVRRRVRHQHLRHSSSDPESDHSSTDNGSSEMPQKAQKSVTVKTERKPPLNALNLPALTPLSFRFLPASESMAKDFNKDGKMPLPISTLEEFTYQFDGSRLEMHGFVLSEDGIMERPQGTETRKREVSESISTDGAGEAEPSVAEKIGKSWRSTLAKVSDLGRGASGSVYSAVHLPTFSLVAIKEIRFADRESRHQTAKELKALWHNLGSLRGGSNNSLSPVVQCSKIVKFYDAYLDSDRQSVSLVLEYVDGGSLQDLVESISSAQAAMTITSDAIESSLFGITNEFLLANIARDVLIGLDFMHSNNIAHLDIKPANILLASSGEAKITDFGLARQLEREGFFHATTFVGTTKYMSPERLRGEKYSFEADIWSLGLTLLTVALGRYPISLGGKDSKAGGVYWSLLERLVHEPPPSLPFEESSPFSSEAKDFIDKCLQIDPTLRGRASDLLQHPWILKFGGNLNNGSTTPKAAPSTSGLELQDITDSIVKALLESKARSTEPVVLDNIKIQRLAKQLHVSVNEIQDSLQRSAMELPTCQSQTLSINDENDDDDIL